MLLVFIFTGGGRWKTKNWCSYFVLNFSLPVKTGINGMEVTQRNRLGDGLFIFCSRCNAPASVCHALWIQWLQSLSAAWWVCPAVANDIDSRALTYCKSPTSSPTLTVTVTTGIYRPHTCTRDWQSPGSRGFHGILVGMETEMLMWMGWECDRHGQTDTRPKLGAFYFI